MPAVLKVTYIIQMWREAGIYVGFDSPGFYLRRVQGKIMMQVIAGSLQSFLKTPIRLTRYAVPVIIMVFAANVSAQVISSTELINKSKDYDAQTVAYQGEVIGDVMARENSPG